MDKIKTQYTKKQIIEISEYWKFILQRLDESIYNNVIDMLIIEFGKDLVLSKSFNYTLTHQDLKIIFKILNKNLFNNQIKFVPIMLWPMTKLVDKLNYHAKMSGDQNKEIHTTNCLGVHTAICIDIFNKNHELIDIKNRDSYLIINSSEMKNTIFIFTVAVICHEMIHVFDYQNSSEIHDMELNWEICSYKGLPVKELPNFHKTTIFKNKMKESNENGINVVEELSSDNSHKIDNINARYVLKTVIGESENPDVETLSTAHDLFLHNKKTGYCFFAHFD